MKRETQERNIKIANDIMYYIYTHIDLNIDIEELSQMVHVSRFHMQRIFKEVFGRNIYETIKSIRLEKAANLLLVNRLSTISDIANQCGYTSQTSFIKAFKQRFLMTPTQWRVGGYRHYSRNILAQSIEAIHSEADFSTIEPKIVKQPEIRSYYIRHNGYNRSIRQSWQKLQVFLLSNNIETYQQIGLYHDNPAVKPLDACQYVACIATDKSVEGTKLPQFKIAGGVYARFDLEGSYGDDLKFIHWVYNEWFPQNGYETTPKPSYAIYSRNGFLEDDEKFQMSYFVSIKM
ncbi:MAG: AraC family transcriptional regulator [Hydrogenimonas sp.]|nr:MAG: AraC family transcriptional regulator [Hydrogenimonas sp.]